MINTVSVELKKKRSYVKSRVNFPKNMQDKQPAKDFFKTPSCIIFNSAKHKFIF